MCTSVAVADPATTTAAAPTTVAATSAAPVAAQSTDSTTANAAADSTTSADLAQGGPLSDVPANSWAYDAVNQLVKDGLIIGYPDGTFKGNRPMTRYEAAVLTYRAVDKIEAQIAAGKGVSQADLDAVRKLLAAFGNELKAAETHIDALQQQQNALQKEADASAAVLRRQQIHLAAWFRSYAYNGNVSVVNGPGTVFSVNGTATAPGVTAATPTGSLLAVGPGQTIPGGLNAQLNPATGGFYGGLKGPGGAGGVSWDNQTMPVMGQRSDQTGQISRGAGMSYMSLQFGGNPDDRSQYLVKLTNTYRWDAINGYNATTPAYCAPPAGQLALAAQCNSPTTAGIVNADGVVNSITRLQDFWYQYTSPGGVYVKVGKMQEDEGPKMVISSSWALTDYVNGARIGFRNAAFNAYVGYGFDDPAASNVLLYGESGSQQTVFGEADYQLDHGRTDIGATYSNYVSSHQILYDPYAINCTNGKIVPLYHGQQYTAGQCGAGGAPITYPGAANPITGAYPNITNISGQNYAQPPISEVSLFGVFNYGKIRVVAEGTDRLGNNPYTGSTYTQPLSFFGQADYGPIAPLPGSKGKWNFEVGYFGAGFNSLGPAFGYYAGPAIWSNFGTVWDGYQFEWVRVARYITDTASLAVYYAHAGLLPGTWIPASSPTCPGCSVYGDTRNAVFGEFFLGF
jgi:hypothetical protein